MLLDRGADINQAKNNGTSPLWIACTRGHKDVAALLLDRGADINPAKDNGVTPLSISCKKGYLAISELLIVSNKFNGYTPDQLKQIIYSCTSDNHVGSSSAMSYSIIGYQCYKHLDDPDYMLDAQAKGVIDRGQKEKVIQTKLLVSMFVNQTRNYTRCSLQGNLWGIVSSYLPRDWLGR